MPNDGLNEKGNAEFQESRNYDRLSDVDLGTDANTPLPCDPPHARTR